jgi:hypothetical protein
VLTSAPHWVELVAQLGSRESLEFAWLINRNFEQSVTVGRLLAGGCAEAACIAMHCSVRSMIPWDNQLGSPYSDGSWVDPHSTSSRCESSSPHRNALAEEGAFLSEGVVVPERTTSG